MSTIMLLWIGVVLKAPFWYWILWTIKAVFSALLLIYAITQK